MEVQGEFPHRPFQADVAGELAEGGDRLGSFVRSLVYPDPTLPGSAQSLGCPVSLSADGRRGFTAQRITASGVYPIAVPPHADDLPMGAVPANGHIVDHLVPECPFDPCADRQRVGPVESLANSLGRRVHHGGHKRHPLACASFARAPKARRLATRPNQDETIFE
ncbi:hypothetical protein CT0861_07686 [Colletotrichum tofieldiae]|uniref:Uncharacterized protein n=1 Tax=Colletotrichum tofieldiae TaxID=708197 RepID=A0A161YFI1_9PEZI|nr:hypothetical protein CT0861_07686 [Colletotrichum tofieldiae]